MFSNFMLDCYSVKANVTANPVSSSDSFVKASAEETGFYIESWAYVYEC